MFSVDDMEISCCYPACFDRSTNTLFYQNFLSGMLKSMDMNRGTFQTHCHIDFKVTFMVMIDDNIHMFGSRPIYSSPQIHCVLRKSSWEMISEKSMHENSGKFDQCAYCEPRKTIIHHLWGDKWLREYSVNTDQWTTMNWSRPLLTRTQFPGMVFTSEGRYALLFGGRHRGIRTDVISIYDFKTQQRSESSLKCPKKGRYSAVVIGDTKKDEIAVFGFINKTFKEPMFRDVQILPIYLIEMTAKWYRNEQVYLMTSVGAAPGVNDHWRINIDDVLQ